MLKQLKIVNFTVFAKADFKFSSGLNVIVGENGTGKSHVLKLVYSVIPASEEEKRKSHIDEISKSSMQRKYADKLLNVFRPDTLGRLASCSQGRIRCDLQFKFDQPALDTSFSFATNSKSEVQITFPDNTVATQYDDWGFYRQRFNSAFAGTKAVDILHVDVENTAWLIEIKDYCTDCRTKPSDLGEEIALKVRDTLVGLVAARFQSSDRGEQYAAKKICKPDS